MIQFDDPQSAWIRQALTPVDRSPDGIRNSGVPVSAVVPVVYNRFVKLLHGITADFTYTDDPLTSEEEAIMKFPQCEPLQELLSRLRTRQSKRIRWTELAQLLSLPLSAEFSSEWCLKRLEPGCWARYISGPADGALDDDEAIQLFSVLSKVAPPQEITCRLADMSVSEIGTCTYHTGTLDDILQLLLTSGYNSLPEYWWPADKKWCVVSDYDLTFTLIGGSNELCDALLETHALECIEVLPSTRVDIYAPIPNP